MAGISEADAKKAKAGLRKGAAKQGIKPGTERHRAYVYGGLRNIHWYPSRERKRHRGGLRSVARRHQARTS